MGAYTCEFGVVHKTCRCPTPHSIKCDKVGQHGPKPVPQHTCLVMQMRLDGRLDPFGKHEAHEPHDWWYTTYGGGHQMDYEPEPGDSDFGKTTHWYCPGRD